MAEILLSLTIIGVVAAITLPSLTGNINERTWNTQRKALFARMSQAISLMPAINGYGNLIEDASGSVTTDTAAETFITAGLAGVMKINNICDNEHLEDCGIPTTITTLNAENITVPKTMKDFNSGMVGSGSSSRDSFSTINTKAAAFETQNGESIIVYYNPLCRGDIHVMSVGSGMYYTAPKVCANFVYDLNGKKGPNTVGKDIGFITALNPSDIKVVAPMPATRALTGTFKMKAEGNEVNATKACTNYDKDYRLPNIDELMSMGTNYKLINSDASGEGYWSSTKISSNLGLAGNWIAIDTYATFKTFGVWCIKR